MAKDITAEFKTLLTKDEYDLLYEKFKEHPGNLQTNYYFDTKRFTLKASDAVLRVKSRDGLTLTLERKKGYNFVRIDEEITEEQFKHFVETGEIPSEKIAQEVADFEKKELEKIEKDKKQEKVEVKEAKKEKKETSETEKTEEPKEPKKTSAPKKAKVTVKTNKTNKTKKK